MKLTMDDILFTQGNHKLPKSTAIINMTSAKNCPAKRLGLCPIANNKCYACKAERPYRPEVLPFRLRQEKVWRAAPAGLIAEAIIRRSFRCTVNRITLLRFSESGDFHNQADIDKMSEIAHILNYVHIRVYGYTARRDLNFSNVDKNMTVNGSDFMVHNMYVAIPKDELKAKTIVCPGNCRICDLCSKRKHVTIYTGIH